MNQIDGDKVIEWMKANKKQVDGKTYIDPIELTIAINSGSFAIKEDDQNA